jgi:hypothetical protein
VKKRVLGLVAPEADKVADIVTPLIRAEVEYQDYVADIADELVRKWWDDVVMVREQLHSAVGRNRQRPRDRLNGPTASARGAR